MTTKIFIDGDAGTTGLEIRERLAARSDISLVALPQAQRKDVAAKRDILSAVDIAILCLPDDAAKETVALCDALGGGPKVLDASTAHRVAQGWTYGFPELCEAQAAEIAKSRRAHPMIQAGPTPRTLVNGHPGYADFGPSGSLLDHAVFRLTPPRLARAHAG